MVKIESFQNLTVISTPSKASFFHCICNAIYEPYRRGERDKIVNDLIADIAAVTSESWRVMGGEIDNGLAIDAVLQALDLLDVYIITEEGKLYIFPYTKPIIKDRNSVIIMIDPRIYKYSLVGLKLGSGIHTVFKPTHPLIKYLKSQT